MSRTLQVVILCLTIINGIRENDAACCVPPTPAPMTCPAEITTTTTTAPFVCPYLTPTPQPAITAPITSPPPARNPDPGPTAANPDYVLVPTNPGTTPINPGMPSNPGMPINPGMPTMGNMPWYPYPMFHNYMPIVEDPKTGQRYYVVPNPNHRPNKYTQTFNIFSPDPNPGYYPSSSTVAPNNEANQNTTSTEQPTGKS